MIPLRWMVGFFASLFRGQLCCRGFLKLARHSNEAGPKPDVDWRRVRPWITGYIERFFFTLLVAYSANGFPTAMIAWLGLKIATNWNHPDWKDSANARMPLWHSLQD